MLTKEEKAVEALKKSAELASNAAEASKKVDEEASWSATKRRVEVKRRKKKVRAKFGGVIGRVKLMYKLGAFDKVEEDNDEDEDEDEDEDNDDGGSGEGDENMVNDDEEESTADDSSLGGTPALRTKIGWGTPSEAEESSGYGNI